MKSSLRPLVLVLAALMLTSLNSYAASATSATIDGTVTDDHGKPLQNAQIRVEGREGSGLNTVVRTDANGHYSCSGLSDGTFKVTLIIDGQIKASIANAMAQIGRTESLNFSLKKASAAAKPSAVGKHYVWVPAPTGTHLAGSWVEVDDNPDKKLPVGMKERLDWRANAVLRRIQSNAGAARQF